MKKTNKLKSVIAISPLMIGAMVLPDTAMAVDFTTCAGCHGALKAGGGSVGTSIAGGLERTIIGQDILDAIGSVGLMAGLGGTVPDLATADPLAAQIRAGLVTTTAATTTTTAAPTTTTTARATTTTAPVTTTTAHATTTTHSTTTTTLPPQKPLVITGHLGRDGIYVPSTDVWDVECGSRTDSIRASLTDQKPGTMEAFINKDGDTSRITDSGVAVDFKLGQGHYQLNVSNMSGVKGNLFYTVYLNCLDAKFKNTEIQAVLKHHKVDQKSEQ